MEKKGGVDRIVEVVSRAVDANRVSDEDGKRICYLTSALLMRRSAVFVCVDDRRRYVFDR